MSLTCMDFPLMRLSGHSISILEFEDGLLQVDYTCSPRNDVRLRVFARRAPVQKSFSIRYTERRETGGGRLGRWRRRQGARRSSGSSRHPTAPAPGTTRIKAGPPSSLI